MIWGASGKCSGGQIWQLNHVAMHIDDSTPLLHLYESDLSRCKDHLKIVLLRLIFSEVSP